MSIVRYADDFVILARRWADGFLQKVEGVLEGRMELTVNRENTKTLDFREPHTTLTFLGYEFRMVRDRLFGKGKRYLAFGPSRKSLKRVREKIHGITHARNGLLIVAISKPTSSVGAAFHRRPQCWENDSFFASFPCGRRWNAVPTIGF